MAINLRSVYPLAGLPGRTELTEELTEALGAPGERLVALVWIELSDRRTPLLDEGTLRACAERLISRLADGQVLAHAGRDAFAVLADSLDDAGAAAEVAHTLLGAFARPFHRCPEDPTPGAAMRIDARAGVALAPLDGDDPDALIELAALTANGLGGRVTFANATVRESLRYARDLESELRTAISDGELVLHYQPMLDLDGGVVAVESLVRWQHPWRGLVPPGDFIGLAEHSGLIVPLGEWVLSEACRQAALWEREGHPLRVAVNLSPAQLDDAELVPRVAGTLRRTGLNPELLELEITESMFADPQRTAAIVHRLHLLGVRVAIDDFGTGYSSLGQLTRLPIDILKIDRSFVSEATGERHAAAVIAAVIAMARQLELETIAEGVETEAQASFLRERGCHLMQGFFYARPMAAAACGQWLRRHRAETLAAR